MATPAAAATSAASVTEPASYATDSVRSNSTTYQGASLHDVSIAGDHIPDEPFTMVPLTLPSSKRKVYLSPLGSETAQQVTDESLRAKNIGRVILLEQKVNPEFVNGVNSALTLANADRLQVEKVERLSPEHIEGMPNLKVMKLVYDFTHEGGRNAWILGPDRTLVAVCLWLLENPKIKEIGKAFEIIGKEEIDVSQLPQGQLQTFLDRLNGQSEEEKEPSVGVRRPSDESDYSVSIPAYQVEDTGSSDDEEAVHQKGFPQGRKSKLNCCKGFSLSSCCRSFGQRFSSCWSSFQQRFKKTVQPGDHYNAIGSPRKEDV